MFLFANHSNNEHVYHAVPLNLSGESHEIDALRAVLSDYIVNGTEGLDFRYNSEDGADECPLILRAMEKYKEWRLQPAAKKAKKEVSNDDSDEFGEEDLDVEIENNFIQNLYDGLTQHDLANFPATYVALFDWTDVL